MLVCGGLFHRRAPGKALPEARDAGVYGHWAEESTILYMVFWNNNRTRNHDDPMKASPPKNEFKIPGHAEARCGALRAGPPCCARQEGGHEARQGLSFQSGVQGFEIRV